MIILIPLHVNLYIYISITIPIFASLISFFVLNSKLDKIRGYYYKKSNPFMFQFFQMLTDITLKEITTKVYGDELENYIEIYEKILDLTPDNSDCALSLMHAYFFSGDFQKADLIGDTYQKKYIKEKIQFLENKTLDYNVLYFNLRKSKKNEPLSLRRIDPGLKIARSRLAHAYNRSKDFKKAKQLSEEILSEFPDYPFALYTLAEANKGLGEKIIAKELFYKVHKILPEYSKPIESIIKLSLEDGNPERAIEVLGNYKPEKAYLWHILAKYYYVHQDYHSTLEICERALSVNNLFKKARKLRKKIRKSLKKSKNS
ncbi:MAG: hypothetical protein GF316_09285 [Candidatus Lokiarchaeota archaeon]|nr:hypothetical protein [Candidatus Lokiarchaeota archaeon]